MSVVRHDNCTVTVLLAGRLGRMCPPVERKLESVMPPQSAPPAGVQLKLEQIKPEEGVSRTTEPSAADKPALAKVMVYTVVADPLNEVVPLVLETLSEAAGLTKTVTVALLLVGTGSLVPAGGWATAVLVMKPLKVLGKATTLKLTLPLTGKVMEALILVVVVVKLAVPPPAPVRVTAPTIVQPASVSVNGAPTTGEGPRLTTVTVKTVVCEGRVLVALATLLT